MTDQIDISNVHVNIAGFGAMTAIGRCTELVEAVGLGQRQAVHDVRALSGGVASDIYSFTLGQQVFCAKFALSRLRVAAEWTAPVRRNKAEYAWLGFAREVSPENAVRLYGHSEELGGFVMDFITGADVYNWKRDLLDGVAVHRGAAAVADLLGRVHAASARIGFDTSAFENRDDFQALRIDPYLLHTAKSHPDLGSRLESLAERLYYSRRALVHGDVSPKNILFRNGRPVILDAECATMGDPAFDPAFCLNHLLLKAIHMPAKREALLAEALAFETAYLDRVDWEAPRDAAARILDLLPALMLARVDGKSPIEYLDDQAREKVRSLARAQFQAPTATLGSLVTVIRNMSEHDA